MRPPKRHAVHGVIAEFTTPTDIVQAARKAHEAGYRKMDAYSPFAIEELSEAIGFHHTRLPLIVLVGGILGCVGGLAMQAWMAGVNYPLNVGGRPLLSWPSFIPITFECTVLAAAGSAVFGMLALNGLPMPYHPVFNVGRFAMASRDHFFLVIESGDPKFDRHETADFLLQLEGVQGVEEVPH
jgi:hypothetical protein